MNKFIFMFGFLVMGGTGGALFAEREAQPAEQTVKGLVKGKPAITYYTTGPLTKGDTKKVLVLVEQLKKYTHGGFSPWNLMRGQNLRKQLSNDHNLHDVTTIEQLVKAKALIVMSSDDAIFLVRKEYQGLLQDCFPDSTFEENQVAFLPGNYEEIKGFMEDLEDCYEAEQKRDAILKVVDIEKGKLKSLEAEFQKLENIEKTLASQAKELQKQISRK